MWYHYERVKQFPEDLYNDGRKTNRTQINGLERKQMADKTQVTLTTVATLKSKKLREEFVVVLTFKI